MYLRELFIKNSGPLSQLHIEFAFTTDNRPVPHVIVGKNGKGKTNLLSIIADALIEGAAAPNVYSDIVTPVGAGRNYFRVVGGKTRTHGENSGFSILRFQHDETQLFYSEHTGPVTAAEGQEIIPPTLNAGANWGDDGKDGKTFTINEDTVRSIYQGGAHAFFPSSRSEVPFWLNQASIFEDTFDTTERFTQTLGKPIYVEHGVDLFAQWLLGVLTESRARLGIVPDPNNPGSVMPGIVEPQVLANAHSTLQFANQILQAIMDDSQAQFYWAGRRQPRKVGVASGNQRLAAGLDSLSGGQSSLLAIFGTILRYGDAAGIAPQDLQGIVVIDELDAHMHIDLQMKSLPNLIAQFPCVQFIMSSHSPFFALGMEKRFPDNGVRIIELPGGISLAAEAYFELENALGALRETRAFENEVGEFLNAAEEPIIFVEGKTDVLYFQKAASLLGYPQLVDYFQFIGKPGQSGGVSHAGFPALNSTVGFLKANPGFTHRTVVVLYDNDANQTDETFESIHIIGLPKIEGAAVDKGIENMLPAHVFTDDMYDEKKIPTGIGRPKIIPDLRKTHLCERLCGEDADAANFQNFGPILERINEIVNGHTGLGEADEADEGGTGSTDGGTAESSPQKA